MSIEAVDVIVLCSLCSAGLVGSYFGGYLLGRGLSKESIAYERGILLLFGGFVVTNLLAAAIEQMTGLKFVMSLNVGLSLGCYFAGRFGNVPERKKY